VHPLEPVRLIDITTVAATTPGAISNIPTSASPFMERFDRSAMAML